MRLTRLDYSFWDLFRTIIHKRTDIKVPDKFHYLIFQLQGEAANILSGFDHIENSYQEAVELLITTYGKPKILVQAHLSALFDLESPQPTAADLSNYRVLYEGHLRALHILEYNITDFGYIYAELILRKLPKKTKDNIGRANKSDAWDLTLLRQAISNEIGHLSAI